MIPHVRPRASHTLSVQLGPRVYDPQRLDAQARSEI